LMTPD